MLTNLIPLLYVLAEYAATSPVIPPPNAIKQSSLLNLFLKRMF
jgi:hypothetical protein